MSKINIYLDLDETLIFSIDKNYPHKNIKNKKIDIDHLDKHYFEDYIVLYRPGLQRFLDWLCRHFNVSIWSAGQKEYVHNIVSKAVKTPNRKIQRVLTYDDCEKSMKKYGPDSLKDIRLLHQFADHNNDNILLLDDLYTNTSQYPPNKHNSIRIKKFQGDVDDNCLSKTKKDLELILAYYKNDKNLESIKFLRKNL
jgi:hypothetical protein